jgi:hypothetical protein
MDRRAIAREGRRTQALDALEFERERESALLLQIADIVLEQEGHHVDDGAFARLSPEDVGLIRSALGYQDPASADGDAAFVDPEDDEPDDDGEEELARLGVEVELCRARQGALERYVEALTAEALEASQQRA